jgi:hypothetical protein
MALGALFVGERKVPLNGPDIRRVEGKELA